MLIGSLVLGNPFPSGFPRFLFLTFLKALLVLVPFYFKYEIWFSFQFLISKAVLISILFLKKIQIKLVLILLVK
jgi:hypothetical protein